MRDIFHQRRSHSVPTPPGAWLALLLTLLPLLPAEGQENCCASHAAAVGPVEILRQAGEILVAGLDAVGETLAGRLADTVMEGVVPGTVLQASGGKGKADPLELLAELEAALSCPDCGKPLPGEAVAAAAGKVFGQARQAADKPGAAVGLLAGYCLVIPLLGTPDESWDAAATASLPEWFRAPPWKEPSEAFALHAGRPATAYHLAEPAASPDGGDPLSAYLLRAADRMAAERDYPAELACLRAGLRRVRSRDEAGRTAEFACRLGERLADHGYPAEAAALLQDILAEKPVPEADRIAVVRLTYLYKAEDFATVAAEADRCLESQQHSDHRIQLLYLAWAAYRRQGEREKADSLATALLASYPTHPLAADVLYSRAMDALAQADYDGALALLTKIRREFPESRLKQRVDDLLTRLAPLGASARQAQ
jgi:tetratricopeptide (TPR) repeat protein